MSNFSPPEVHGACFGVDITPRTKAVHSTDSPLVRICIEDDEQWFRKDVKFDAYWIDDLIDVLTRAKALCAKRSGSRATTRRPP